jgi:hypothetical protein
MVFDSKAPGRYEQLRDAPFSIWLDPIAAEQMWVIPGRRRAVGRDDVTGHGVDLARHFFKWYELNPLALPGPAFGRDRAIAATPDRDSPRGMKTYVTGVVRVADIHRWGDIIPEGLFELFPSPRPV